MTLLGMTGVGNPSGEEEGDPPSLALPGERISCIKVQAEADEKLPTMTTPLTLTLSPRGRGDNSTEFAFRRRGYVPAMTGRAGVCHFWRR